MNKTIYTFILFLLIPFVAFGQDKISVADFALAPKDLTAIQQGTMLADQNGEKCAIIKVKTTEKSFLLWETSSKSLRAKKQKPKINGWRFLCWQKKYLKANYQRRLDIT